MYKFVINKFFCITGDIWSRFSGHVPLLINVAPAVPIQLTDDGQKIDQLGKIQERERERQRDMTVSISNGQAVYLHLHTVNELAFNCLRGAWDFFLLA